MSVEKPVVKTRRKVEKVTSDETLLKCIEHLRGDDKKRANKVRRILSDMDPDRLMSLGVTPEELQGMTKGLTRTFVFGTLGRLFSGERTPISGSIMAAPHERDMRAGNEYYNMLVRAIKPLLEAYNKLIDGPEQQLVRELNEAINTEYVAIREINGRGRGATAKKRRTKVEMDADKKAQEAEIRVHLEVIHDLKKKRNFDAARKERLAKKKEHKDVLDTLNSEVNALTRGVRAYDNRPGAIWNGNYGAIEAAFTKAKDKALETGNLPHLRNEYKGEADNFMTNPRWNGEGKITASHSNAGNKAMSAHEAQKWSSILAGENPFMKVRKFTSADLANHGLKDTFKIKDNLHLISIRRCGPTDEKKGDQNPFVSAAVVLHRQPNPDDRITISSFVTKKVALKHVTELQLCVNMTSSKAPGTQSTFVAPCWETQEDGSVVAAYWQRRNKSGKVTIPARIGKGLDYSKSLDATMSSYVSAFNTLRKSLDMPLENRGTSYWNGRTDNPILKPKTAKSNREVLSSLYAEVRAHEEVHGHMAGGGESGTEDLVEAFYLRLKEYFTFPSRMEGFNFTMGWLLRRKYQHLYPWAVNERNGCLLLRREIYRVFASEVMDEAGELHIPDTDYRNRNMSESQKLVAPSELLDILKNYAQREGIRVFKEEESVVSANIQWPNPVETSAKLVTRREIKALAAAA